MNKSIEVIEREGAEDGLKAALQNELYAITNRVFSSFIKDGHFDGLGIKIIDARQRLLRVDQLLNRLKTYNDQHN